MKKDIQFLPVENIAIAIVNDIDENGENNWFVYLLNMKDEPITGTLVSSKGYGTKDGNEVKTSVLRHFLDVVPAQSSMKIERIMENVFGLTNEYFLSFYHNGTIYDKKYIFLPETINEEFFSMIPLLNKKGVMIK